MRKRIATARGDLTGDGAPEKSGFIRRTERGIGVLAEH